VRNLIDVITRNDVDWARLDADLVLTTIEPPRPIGGALVIHPFLTEVDVSNIRQFVSRARRSRRRALIRDDLLRFFAPRCCYATSIPAMPRP
jgi:lichenan operon transcriptional antiterminator